MHKMALVVSVIYTLSPRLVHSRYYYVVIMKGHDYYPCKYYEASALLPKMPPELSTRRNNWLRKLCAPIWNTTHILFR